MVANVFVFAAKVIGTNKVRDHKFVVVDGSVHNIKPVFNKKNLPIKFLRQSSGISRKKESFNIVGYTCMEKDYLAHDVNWYLPQVNDFIIFENVGAYTIVFNPPFI
ncbi:hypothetical protein M3234_13495 [Neobacillus niacini]|nr:hypothetical protein [Neobacillus niacini]